MTGPGQNASISLRARPGISSTSLSSIVISLMCTITGSHAGRCLAAKIRPTAAASSAFAPNPYTVSVGSATSPPARRICAARSRLSRALAESKCLGSTTSRSVFTSSLSPLQASRRHANLQEPSVLSSSAERNGCRGFLWFNRPKVTEQSASITESPWSLLILKQ